MQTGRNFYIKILKYKTSALSLYNVNKENGICAFKILNKYLNERFGRFIILSSLNRVLCVQGSSFWGTFGVDRYVLVHTLHKSTQGVQGWYSL